MPKTKYMSEIEYLNKPKFKNESYYVQIIMEKLVGAAMTFPGLDSSRIEKLNIRWWCCCGVDETSNYWFKRRQPFLKSSSFKDDANFQVKTPIRDFSNDLCAKDEKEAEGESLNEKSSTSFEFDIWARKWTWLHQQQQWRRWHLLLSAASQPDKLCSRICIGYIGYRIKRPRPNTRSE